MRCEVVNRGRRRESPVGAKPTRSGFKIPPPAAPVAALSLALVAACAIPTPPNPTKPTSPAVSIQAYDQSVFARLDDTKGLLVRCYQDALAEYPALSARVSFDFVVHGNGQATSPSFAASELRERESETCAQEVLQQTRFAAPSTAGLQRARYSYALSVIAGANAIEVDTSTQTQSRLQQTVYATRKYIDKCFALVAFPRRISPPRPRLKLFISRHGRATAVQFLNDLSRDPKLQDCLVSALRGPQYFKPTLVAVLPVDLPLPDTTQRPGGQKSSQPAQRIKSKTSTSTSVRRGRLKKSEIGNVIRTNLHQFKACYEQGLALRDEIEGKVTVRFSIERDGNVVQATVRYTSLLDADTESCIIETFGRLKFPKPRGNGPVHVTYPLTFTSN